ncbi:MAG: preprotein translocase subunit YajC [Alteraurantiacibacter sp.]
MLDYLAAAGASSAPAYLVFLPYIGIAAVFWFLIIRPQMRQQKDQRTKIAGVKRGDQIVTSSGIVGKVTKVDDDYAEVEIAKGVTVKVVRSMIGDVVSPVTKPAND